MLRCSMGDSEKFLLRIFLNPRRVETYCRGSTPPLVCENKYCFALVLIQKNEYEELTQGREISKEFGHDRRPRSAESGYAAPLLSSRYSVSLQSIDGRSQIWRRRRAIVFCTRGGDEAQLTFHPARGPCKRSAKPPNFAATCLRRRRLTP
jgi:hypothetical protein